jgi:hypothetical protein
LEALALLIGLIVLGIPVGLIVLIAVFVGRGREVRELRSRVEALEDRYGVLARRVRDIVEPPASAAAPAGRAEPAPPPVAKLEHVMPAVAPPPPVTPPAAPPVAARAAAPPPAAPPRAPSIPPPAAPRPPARPASPPPPREPAFDWESLLGVKGAAIVGGIALVIAAVLVAKLAIDRGWVTPEMRLAMIIGSGLAMLIGAEVSLRRGYETTANAVSGAGIAVLYIGFYAGRAIYDLFSLPVTFAMMSMVTVVAGLLAVRYDAMVTAVLGLLGGFATPVLLSTGENRPIGLFSYLLLLNAGLLTIAVKRGWHVLAGLSLFATFLIQWGWFAKFMAPDQLVIGLGAFALFAMMYVGVSLLASAEKTEGDGLPSLLSATGSVGGLVPLGFALILAADKRYAEDWPLLFGYMGLLSAGLGAVAVWRGRVGLAMSGAMATALTLAVWGADSLSAENVWATSVAAAVLVAIWNILPRLSERVYGAEGQRTGLEMAALVASCGLGLYAAVLVGRGFGEPAGPFLMLLAALAALALERTRPSGLAGTAVFAPTGIAALTQLWFFPVTTADTLAEHLAVPLLVVAFFAIVAALRRGGERETMADGGVLGAAAVALLGLWACLFEARLGADPVPLFAALAVLLAIGMIASARAAWSSAAVGGSLAVAALYLTIWQAGYFQPEDGPIVVGFAALYYLAFLVLPFAAPGELARLFRERRTPWVASALSGPLFFVVLHRAFRAMGGGPIIGVLPVLMAGLSVAVLAAVSRRFTEREPVLRLRYLALFSAVALWFVALAIPLQLDRQWITIGWALEGAAVFWLYGRLPHRGLRTFGAVLFALVGARLLFNPYVLDYQERGAPIVNWLLYTYGVPVLACLLGASALRRAEESSKTPTWIPTAVSFLGLILLFVLINLEIFDFYGTGRFVALDFERRNERDLTMSAAWGLYAIGLLVVGVWRDVRALRFVSLGFLLLTVAKVFLYDLANLVGFARILSFLGLGLSLIVVSLFYQRFVFRKEAQ